MEPAKPADSKWSATLGHPRHVTGDLGCFQVSTCHLDALAHAGHNAARHGAHSMGDVTKPGKFQLFLQQLCLGTQVLGTLTQTTLKTSPQGGRTSDARSTLSHRFVFLLKADALANQSMQSVRNQASFGWMQDQRQVVHRAVSVVCMPAHVCDIPTGARSLFLQVVVVVMQAWQCGALLHFFFRKWDDTKMLLGFVCPLSLGTLALLSRSRGFWVVLGIVHCAGICWYGLGQLFGILWSLAPLARILCSAVFFLFRSFGQVSGWAWIPGFLHQGDMSPSVTSLFCKLGVWGSSPARSLKYIVQKRII